MSHFEEAKPHAKKPVPVFANESVAGLEVLLVNSIGFGGPNEGVLTPGKQEGRTFAALWPVEERICCAPLDADGGRMPLVWWVSRYSYCYATIKSAFVRRHQADLAWQGRREEGVWLEVVEVNLHGWLEDEDQH